MDELVEQMEDNQQQHEAEVQQWQEYEELHGQ
jgi:hypothetical protein